MRLRSGRRSVIELQQRIATFYSDTPVNGRPENVRNVHLLLDQVGHANIAHSDDTVAQVSR